MKQFEIPKIQSGEFILDIVEETKIGFLIHYAAPFTGAGECLMPSGIKFSISGNMRDDAFYMDVYENNEKTKDELWKKLEVLANTKYPKLANRIRGFSFFITVEQIKSSNIRFLTGDKNKLHEIISKNKEQTEYYKNYNQWEDEEYLEQEFGSSYNELTECGKPKILKQPTNTCPCCGSTLRPVIWGEITPEILKLKKERKIFIGEELFGKDDIDYKKKYNLGFVQEYTRPQYACGNCGESFILK